MPAQRGDKAPKKDVRTEPYRRPETRFQVKKQAKFFKQIDEREQMEMREKEKEPLVRRILQRTPNVPTNEEDIVMEPVPESAKTIPAEPKATPKVNKPRPNVTFEHMEIMDEYSKDKASANPKRASPSFKFASTTQESVNQDELLELLLNEPVKITFRELLSLCELSKRAQAITISQKIPIGVMQPAAPMQNAPSPNTVMIKRSAYTRVEEIEDLGSDNSSSDECQGDMDMVRTTTRVSDLEVYGLRKCEIRGSGYPKVRACYWPNGVC